MTTQQQYELLHKALHEQQWRLYLGTEALKIGSGGISQVAALSGADWKTVQRGVKELKGERARTEGRIRPTGGEEEGDGEGFDLAKGSGRVAGAQRGSDEPGQMDEARAFRTWSRRSREPRHRIKKTALAELLHARGYSRHPSTRKRWKALPTSTAISSLAHHFSV